MTLLDTKTKRLPAILIAAAIIVVFGSEAARLTMSLPGESAPYFWSMLGLAVGLALAIERRYWPWLILLLVLIDLPYLDADAYNLKFAFGFVLEYGSYFVVVIGGCWILRKRHPDGLDLTRLNTDLRDFLIAAGAIAACTGALEPLYQLVARGGPIRWRDWYFWFALDLMSILVVAPFISAWLGTARSRRSFRSWVTIAELTMLAIAGYLIFFLELFGPPGTDRTNFDFVWVLVLWGIFRFDLRIVTTIILFTTAFVTARTNLSPEGLEYLSSFWQDQSLIMTSYASVATALALIVNALFVYANEKRFEIQQARKYLDSLFQETGSYLWIYNVANRSYEYFSDTETGHWTDTMGMHAPPENIFKFLHPGEDKTARPIWKRILNGEQQQSFNFAYRLVNEDGDIRWDRNIGIPLFDEDRAVARYVGMILDITEEQGLRTERNHLHDVIRESEKLHAIGTLSAGMAHDWNNLLLVLSMEASRIDELASQYPDLKDTVAALNQIVAEGRGITDELMSLARREREPTAVCNLYDEVQKGTDLLGRAVPSNIHVTTDFDPDGKAPVRCKVTHLIQTILNLGLNARDAIGKNGGTIAIRLEGPHAGIIDDRERSVATLLVSDDGQGIPDDEIDQILQPLYTTKAARGGTGLGLSVVRGFVSEMGGQMSIESEEGAGTTVAIVIPIVPDPLDQATTSQRQQR